MEERRNPTELKITLIAGVAAAPLAALLFAIGWIEASPLIVAAFLLCGFVMMQL